MTYRVKEHGYYFPRLSIQPLVKIRNMPVVELDRAPICAEVFVSICNEGPSYVAPEVVANRTPPGLAPMFGAASVT